MQARASPLLTSADFHVSRAEIARSLQLFGRSHHFAAMPKSLDCLPLPLHQNHLDLNQQHMLDLRRFFSLPTHYYCVCVFYALNILLD